MEKKRRRKVVLINKKFQYKMIAKFIVLNMAIMVLFAVVIFFFMDSEIGTRLNEAHNKFRDVRSMLMPVVITLSCLNILIASIVIWGVVLFSSHRIAGPLYRFKEELKKIYHRNLKPIIGIRDDDQLYECSAALKEMSEVLSGDLQHIKQAVAELKSLEKKGSSKELKKKIQEIDEILEQYTFQ
ncbi:MAG: hypothetical protein GY754_06470 [bacterium]|nr:hypothetical protein [bacterium]